jgi:hypothetical protein
MKQRLEKFKQEKLITLLIPFLYIKNDLYSLYIINRSFEAFKKVIFEIQLCFKIIFMIVLLSVKYFRS